LRYNSRLREYSILIGLLRNPPSSSVKPRRVYSRPLPSRSSGSSS
jgi:hypothetical protein